MAVISTTGQGQGAAQVVKQRPSQMGTIISSFVDDYLTEQAEKAKAEQEAEAARYKASLMQGKLKGAFKGKSDAIKNEIDKKVKKGEISPTAGGEILMGQVEELASKQNAFIKGISSPNKTFSYSSDGSFDPNPTLSMYNNLFGDEAEQNGLNDFNKVLEQNEALLLRAEEKPKKDLVEIYRTEFMPLVEDMYKINIDESLSEEEQNKIIKTTIKSLSSEDQQVIIDRFSENEDVIKNIILQSPNEAQTITENGVVLNMPFINKESEKFAKSFLGIRQTVSEDIQKTGDGNKKELIVVGDKEKETYGDPVDEKIREVQQISVREPNSTRKQSITFGQNTGFITGVTKEEDGVKVRFEYKKGGETKTEIVPLYEVQSYLTEDQTKQIEETGNKLQIEYKPNIDNYIKSVVTTLGLGDKTEQAQDIKVFLKEATNIEDPTGRDNISFTYKDIDYSFNLDKPEEQERLKKLVKDSNTPKQAPKPREAVYTDDEVKAMYGKKVSKETFKKMTVKQRAKFAQNAGSWE